MARPYRTDLAGVPAVASAGLASTLGSQGRRVWRILVVELSRRPWGLCTRRGRDCVAAGRTTMEGVEEQITEALGEGGQAQLVRLLRRLLKAARNPTDHSWKLRLGAMTDSTCGMPNRSCAKVVCRKSLT